MATNTFKSQTLILAADVPNAGTFVAAYPAGSVQADFTGANANVADEVMLINDNDRYDGTKVDIAYGASNITVTNNTGGTLKAGARVLLQLAQANRAPFNGAKGPAIAAPTGGTTVDAEGRVTIGQIIATLKSAGITA